jgi:hypothetical protein
MTNASADAWIALGMTWAVVVGLPTSAWATSCDQATELVVQACARDADSDKLLAAAACANFGDPSKAAGCLARADEELHSAQDLCTSQAEARARVCGAVGQAPYDPPIDPANFVDQVTNRYFPLQPGTVWTYRGEGSATKVEVTNRKRRIMGVNCVVVRDTVTVAGKVEEDTFDYYAQDRQGNVWYFGESTAEYVNGYIVSIEGSFVAGRDRAKPGIIMPAHPAPGMTMRQEFALDEAEDLARYERVGGTLTTRFGTYRNVLKTFEFTPLEPEARENKYYAPGIGNVLTVDLVTGEREVLVEVDH